MLSDMATPLLQTLNFKNKLKFRFVNKLEDAKNLWEFFSTKNTIDDEWDFRYAFCKYSKSPLYFLVGFDGNYPVGLLPLQLNFGNDLTSDKYGLKGKFLEFFGGDDTDSNQIYMSRGYEDQSLYFLNQLPFQSLLYPLAVPYFTANSQPIRFTDKYTTHLIDYESFLVTNFGKESRKTLLKQIRRLTKNYEIKIEKAEKSDLELLFQLNKQRFGDKSSLQTDAIKFSYYELLKLFENDLFSVKVNGTKKAISMALIYKNIYVGMSFSYDYSVRDLGKYVAITQIQRAIELGCSIYDAGKGDSGWKENFGLTKTPQYMLKILPLSQNSTNPSLGM
jgi:hypothetical protein